MKEKDFQVRFNKWCKYYVKKTSVFELKITQTNSIPFAAVKEHQASALHIAKHSALVYKIPDAGYQNPFDSLIIRSADAYVVIMFYSRGEKIFYMIDIDDWIIEQKNSPRKSLTRERAASIGKICELKIKN